MRNVNIHAALAYLAIEIRIHACVKIEHAGDNLLVI